MTNAQSAIADALAALTSDHGISWTRTSDGAAFTAVAGALQAAPVQFANAQDRSIRISFPRSSEPSPVIRAGDELTSGGINYRVTRRDFDTVTQLVVLEATATP